MKPNILVWTSLVTGPRDSFGLHILRQAFVTIPDVAFEIVSNFIKDDNILFMRQYGHHSFRLEDELFGNFEFSMLMVPTNSWDMMAEIHNSLIAVGIPCAVERMNQFVSDVVMIMQSRFGFHAVVRIYGRPPYCVLIIAPEEA